MGKHLITFCIMHTRRLECTRRCLDSIFETVHTPYQILLLIQGNTHTIQELEYFVELSKKPNVRYIYAPTNIGPLFGRNLLVKEADSQFIMVVDNDIYFQKGWLSPMLRILGNPKIAGVSLPLTKSDGTVIQTGGGYYQIKKGVFHIRRAELPPNGESLEVDNILDGCFMFKKEVKPWIRYDPEYKIGYGSLQMSLHLFRELEKRDMKVAISLKSRAEHWQPPDPNYKELRMNYRELSHSYARFRRNTGLRLPLKKHVVVKYLYPFLPRRLARLLRWLRRKPPLIWIWKPKIL